MASMQTDYLSFPLCSPSQIQSSKLHSAASRYLLKHIQNGDILVKKKRMNTKPIPACPRVLTPRHRSSGTWPQSPHNKHNNTLLANRQQLQTSSPENEQPVTHVATSTANDCTFPINRRPCQQQNFNHDTGSTEDVSPDSALEFAACSDCSKACNRSLDNWMDHLADKHPVPVKWLSSRAASLKGEQQAFPYSAVVGSHKKRKADIIPRPLNSFMVFAQYLRRVILYSFPDAHNVHISQRVGQLWRQLSEALRDQYAAEASRLQRLHSMEFPNYKYQPKKRATTIRPGQGIDEADYLQAASPLTNVDDQTASEWDSPLLRMDSNGSVDTCCCASGWGESSGEITELAVDRAVKQEYDNLKSTGLKEGFSHTHNTRMSFIDHSTQHHGEELGSSVKLMTDDAVNMKPAIGIICAQSVPNNHNLLMPATLISMRWPAPIPTEVIDRLNVANQSDAPLTLLVSGPESTPTSAADEEITTIVYGHHNVVQVKPSTGSGGTLILSNSQSELPLNSGTLEDLLNSPSMFAANPTQSKFIILEPLKVSLRSPVMSLPAAFSACHYVVAANDCHVSTQTSWSKQCPASTDTLGSTSSLSPALPGSAILDGYTVLHQPLSSSSHNFKEVTKRDSPDTQFTEHSKTTLENLSNQVKNNLLSLKVEESVGGNLSDVVMAMHQQSPPVDVNSIFQIKEEDSPVELDPANSIGFDDIDTCGPSPSLEELGRLALFNTQFSEFGSLNCLTEKSGSPQALTSPPLTPQVKDQLVLKVDAPQCAASDLIPPASSSLPSIESWTFGSS